MTACTVTLADESGNHAMHTIECASIKEAVWHFEQWVDEVDRYSRPQNANGLIDVADCVAYVLSVGPRGGIRKESL